MSPEADSFASRIPVEVQEKIARGEIDPPGEEIDDHPSWPMPAMGPAIGKFGAKASKASRDAAIAVYPRTGTQKYKILRLLAYVGERGMTCDEMEERLDAPHQSISARWHELWHDHGYIEPNLATRPTRNKADAEVFVLTKTGLSEMRAHGDWT